MEAAAERLRERVEGRVSCTPCGVQRLGIGMRIGAWRRYRDSVPQGQDRRDTDN